MPIAKAPSNKIFFLKLCMHSKVCTAETHNLAGISDNQQSIKYLPSSITTASLTNTSSMKPPNSITQKASGVTLHTEREWLCLTATDSCKLIYQYIRDFTTLIV